MSSPFKSITLSAPKTKSPGFCMLILLAFSSARFLEINSGDTFSLIKDFLTWSSSILAGITSQLILLDSKICFLTPLFDASIILLFL